MTGSLSTSRPKHDGDSSLRRLHVAPAPLALHEFRPHLLRKGRRFQLVGVSRIAPDEYAGLEALERQRLALENLMRDVERRALDALDPALDRDPVAIGGRDVELGAGVDHGDADEPIAT